MAILFIITGGTFDKEYDYLTGNNIFTSSHVSQMLERGNVKADIVLKELFLIDSLDMTDIHRESIASEVISSTEDKIVITHGTDTMVETAKTISSKFINNKTVVLTGAMIPYTMANSDALFNLGVAMAYSQTARPGVYIAMHGLLFNYDNVYKNISLGQFEAINK